MPAITCEGVGKRYRQVVDAPTFVQRLAASARKGRAREHWAVRDLDLVVERGETVGVIGRNGSGKTTLLRLLAGVSAPTTGRMRVEGSVAPLIGVGVGFNPELTGRENVYVNGRILGLDRRTIDGLYDEIVVFSELGDAVDMPVKLYSSGMFLRLAFAVAVHVRPDVLLVDEVLAVGDLAFQLKCLERMRRMRDGGTTTVIVTHDLGLVERSCDRTLVLADGVPAFLGGPDEALAAYHDLLAGRSGGRATVDVDVPAVVEVGEEVTATITVRFAEEVVDPLLGMMLRSDAAGPVTMLTSQPGDHAGTYGPDRPLVAQATFRTPLLPGHWSFLARATSARTDDELGRSGPARFTLVGDAAPARGILDLDARLVPS